MNRTDLNRKDPPAVESKKLWTVPFNPRTAVRQTIEFGIDESGRHYEIVAVADEDAIRSSTTRGGRIGPGIKGGR